MSNIYLEIRSVQSSYQFEINNGTKSELIHITGEPTDLFPPIEINESTIICSENKWRSKYKKISFTGRDDLVLEKPTFIIKKKEEKTKDFLSSLCNLIEIKDDYEAIGYISTSHGKDNFFQINLEVEEKDFNFFKEILIKSQMNIKLSTDFPIFHGLTKKWPITENNGAFKWSTNQIREDGYFITHLPFRTISISATKF